MGSHCFKVTGQERKNCVLPATSLHATLVVFASSPKNVWSFLPPGPKTSGRCLPPGPKTFGRVCLLARKLLVVFASWPKNVWSFLPPSQQQQEQHFFTIRPPSQRAQPAKLPNDSIVMVVAQYHNLTVTMVAQLNPREYSLRSQLNRHDRST